MGLKGNASSHAAGRVDRGIRILFRAVLGRLSFGGLIGGLALLLANPFTADAATSRLTLSWTDTSDNETGFRIERSTGSATFALIDSVAANVTTYVDATVAPSGSYQYRVYAYNESGNSDFSNVAAGTTPANTAPVVGAIADRTLVAGTSTGAIAFTVSDAQTGADSVTITAGSSNPSLVSAGGIVLGGSGSNRTVTVTPAPTQTGTTTITVTVSDDGLLAASETFLLTVNAAPVAGSPDDRFFFGTLGSGGAFSFVVRADNTATFLGSVPGQSEEIESVDLTIADSGGFSFLAPGVGMVVGQVGVGAVNGTINGGAGVFSGTEDDVVGATTAVAGIHEGVILNTSDGMIQVMAGTDGRALVIASEGGAAASTVATVDASGNISATLPGGRTVALAVNGGQVAGTTTIASQSRAVSGIGTGTSVVRLANTSIRGKVRAGGEIMIAGCVINGTGTRQVLIRGVGPTLASFGVTDTLADPYIAIYRQSDPQGSPPIAQNDDWGSATNAAAIASTAARLGAFSLPGTSKDAVVLLTLPAGGYTVHVSGVAGGTGAAIVEVYDADETPDNLATARLGNISMRSGTGGGDNTVIAGFVVTGTAPQRMLVRAVGPELAQFQVPGVLADPALAIFAGSGASSVQIASNNDWGSDAAVVSTLASEVGAFGLNVGSKSAATVLWLAPGLYTAQASGSGVATGQTIVEVYEVR